MRWEALFRDLEGQLESADRADLASEVADRTRWEFAQLALADRLATAVGADLVVGLAVGEPLRGRLERVGPDWALLSVPGQPDAVVALAAVESLTGLPGLPLSSAPAGAVAGRLDLALALRVLARDRAPVRLSLRNGSTVVGTIDRVGADHVDVAEHALDEVRRTSEVRAVRTIPMAGIVVVRAG